MASLTGMSHVLGEVGPLLVCLHHSSNVALTGVLVVLCPVQCQCIFVSHFKSQASSSHQRYAHLMLFGWKAGAVPFLTSFHMGSAVFDVSTFLSCNAMQLQDNHNGGNASRDVDVEHNVANTYSGSNAGQQSRTFVSSQESSESGFSIAPSRSRANTSCRSTGSEMSTIYDTRRKLRLLKVVVNDARCRAAEQCNF